MKFHAPIHQSTWLSPLGPMFLAASAAGLAGAWFTDQKHLPNRSGWIDSSDHAVLQQAKRALSAYFSGNTHGQDVVLDLSAGTEFQRSVWQALLTIPHGTSVSYGQLASALGRPKAVRAVGAAVGRNPVSILVPCHRVLGAGGALTGYAGGLQRKASLLRLEGRL
jgi:methylated-DNA-[protein]-cysteine S-methyltransferase